MDKITNFNGISVGIGSVMAILVSYALYIINTIKQNIDTNKKESDKDLAELKGVVKEQNLETKKDLGEAFCRIRDNEKMIAVIKVQQDMNNKRGGNDD